MSKLKVDRRLSVAFSDHHIPFQSNLACRMGFNFVKDHKPGLIHLLGDIGDFYTLSKFDKDVSRKATLQDDLDAVNRFLAELRDVAPDAKIIYSEGNHEFRLRRYLRSDAKALESLRALNLDKLLDFEKYNIQYVEQDKPYRVGPLLFTHGQLVRKWSGASAKAHFEKFGCNVLHGHTHRLGSFYHRDVSDHYGAWENGCMCTLNPEYVTAPDWQHGWSVIWSQRDYFHVEQICVIKGRYNYHGKMEGRRKLSPSAYFDIQDLGH